MNARLRVTVRMSVPLLIIRGTNYTAPNGRPETVDLPMALTNLIEQHFSIQHCHNVKSRDRRQPRYCSHGTRLFIHSVIVT